jgi:hypothetical protein
MYYQSDFKIFQPKFDYQRSLERLRHNRGVLKKKPEPEIIIKHAHDDEVDDDDEKPQFLVKCFYDFCENTSIHGVRYIGDTQMHWFERFHRIIK